MLERFISSVVRGTDSHCRQMRFFSKSLRKGIPAAVKRYRTQPYPGKVIVFAGSNKEKLHDARWRQVAADVEVREIGGSHTEIVSANYSRILARNIDETLGAD